MLSQALRRFETRAGVELPAMSRTLQHYLFVSQKLHPDKSALVAAVEHDPALLLSVLCVAPEPINRLDRWADQFSSAMLQAIATVAASNPTAMDLQMDPRFEVWQRALKRSMLAQELAKVLLPQEHANARLIALISEGCGSFLPPNGEDVILRAADLLDEMGCPRMTADAIRYSEIPLERLMGTSTIVQVNALSRVLVDYVDSVEPVVAELQLSIQSLTGMAPEQLVGVLAAASEAFRAACEIIQHESPVDIHSASAMASDASMAAVFHRAILKSEQRPEILLAEMARMLLGAGATCYFHREQSALVSALDGSTVSINLGAEGSVIAESFHSGSRQLAALGNLDLIVERQLLGWLGQSHLICLPLASGVLVLATSQPQLLEREVLTNALMDIAADLYERVTPTPTIEVDQVEHKAREITHEVNNPLAIMQNYLRTLSIKLGSESDVQLEIDALSHELSRISGIVQKYARIGSPQTLDYRVANLNRIVEELVVLMQPGASNINFEMHLDPGIPEVELAEDGIKQVVLNILKNAVEALADHPAGQILVSTEGAVNVDGNPCLEVVISDNGPGMSQDQRLELFSNNASSKGEGRGLGLGIARQLLDEMSGSISCRSNGAAGGASFQILLPVGSVAR
jgi:signal transduction histidine kinase